MQPYVSALLNNAGIAQSVQQRKEILMSPVRIWFLASLSSCSSFLHGILVPGTCSRRRGRDIDKDGKVNFNEFFHGLFDLVRSYDEEGHNSSHTLDDTNSLAAHKLFNGLDKNGDGLMQIKMGAFRWLRCLRTSLYFSVLSSMMMKILTTMTSFVSFTLGQ